MARSRTGHHRAAAALLSGYLLARSATRAVPPRPAPAYEWHAMSVREVRGCCRHPAGHGVAGFGGRPCRDPRRTNSQGILAICRRRTRRVVGSVDAGTGARFGGHRNAGFADRRGDGRYGADRKLDAGGSPAAAGRDSAQPPTRSTDPAARKVAIRPDGTRSYTQVIAERLRPGDLIEVRSNEVVPADARVVEDEDLEVDESSLTGESLPVQKQTDATPGADLADRRCMLYAGTHVVAGRESRW
ncbi:E1-E2 ATPase family protein [Mycobacterium xenopi 4042]|uniref:E1-E2 ATPase family protein n=1 Tax=Mycobacterium xenopi 4042 TaxID=1299334 RepID=X8BHF3_MYCXE|nr:E1-E2 ATPase family protein [Mycobacterium xenopi 4042]